MISREEGRKGRREREEACRRGCDVIIPRSLRFSTPSPSCALLSFAPTHPHPHLRSCRRCDSNRHASQCPPRHRTHSLQYARSHQPVSNKEYGCIANATARLCGTGGPAQVRTREIFQIPKLRSTRKGKKKKKKIYEGKKNLVHHTITLSQRAISIILLSLTPPSPLFGKPFPPYFLSMDALCTPG